MWGYVDKTGREYALVGLVNGSLSVVDVTDPYKPEEVFRSNGITSSWREIKVYNDRAYVVTEASAGVQIVDLSTLPENRNLGVSMFTDSGRVQTIHTLWIDEEGIMYLWGSNALSSKNGYVAFDLKTSLTNPKLYHKQVTPYVHDGLVIGNRMYLSHIYDGYFTIYDVTDKKNPKRIGAQNTPSNFTHNAWPTTDGKHIVTTDERANSYLAVYNIENPANIYETDRIQTNPGSKAIVHNTHILGDFAISSYYTEGVTIHDVSDPENIIEVAKYDCSPFYGSTFNGVWEVYPFLPSGNLVAGDMEGGLYVFRPVYKKGSYINGTVRDEVTGAPLGNVAVDLPGLNQSTLSKTTGVFKLGHSSAGPAAIRLIKAGYQPLVLNNLPLENGKTVVLDLTMKPLTSGIHSLSEGGYSLYPNPVSDRLILTGTEGSPALKSATILSINGAVVKSLEITNNAINQYLDITPGMYLLKVEFGDGNMIVEKIVKK